MKKLIVLLNIIKGIFFSPHTVTVACMQTQSCPHNKLHKKKKTNSSYCFIMQYLYAAIVLLAPVEHCVWLIAMLTCRRRRRRTTSKSHIDSRHGNHSAPPCPGQCLAQNSAATYTPHWTLHHQWGAKVKCCAINHDCIHYWYYYHTIFDLIITHCKACNAQS